MKHPRIIQGGMGIAVSNWRLARAVSALGQLGVVSGTSIDSVLARRLQCGDPGEHIRRALEHFPIPDVARQVFRRYFVEGGKSPDKPFKRLAPFTIEPRRELVELTVVANFVEVFLARTGHSRPVGINLLQKVEMPTLPSLYGAMLAGVGFVLVGAGIPREIPGALDSLARHDETTLGMHVIGAGPEDDFRLRFDPKTYFGSDLPEIERPQFLAIISSSTLATSLLRRATGRIDGFVVEAPTAGGHNAPPRGRLTKTADGEPIYGPKDRVDFAKIADLGAPFWLAGQRARPEWFREARELGAEGVQVGTSFALCRESGLDPDIRRDIVRGLAAGDVRVFTDPVASPTGFPFKVVEGLTDTLAEQPVYEKRGRICDLGYLRTAYKKDDGKLGYRCAAEPVDAWVAKGGDPAETTGRKCLCNALLANIGMPQTRRTGPIEKPLVTGGNDLIEGVGRLVARHGVDYGAADVVADLLGETGVRRAGPARAHDGPKTKTPIPALVRAHTPVRDSAELG